MFVAFLFVEHAGFEHISVEHVLDRFHHFGLQSDVVLRAAGGFTPGQTSLGHDLVVADFLVVFGEHAFAFQASDERVAVLGRVGRVAFQFHLQFAVTLSAVVQMNQVEDDVARASFNFDFQRGFQRSRGGVFGLVVERGEGVGATAGALVAEIGVFTIFELSAGVGFFAILIDVLEGFEFAHQSRSEGFHGAAQQFAGQVDDDFSGGIVTWFDGQNDFVGSREREERSSDDALGRSLVNVSFQAEFNAEQFAADAFVEGVDAVVFLSHDHSHFRFLQFGPHASVGDWSAFEADQFAASGRRANGDSDVLGGRVQINFDFGVDGFEDFQFVDDFQTVVDDWAPTLDIDDQGSDQARFQVGVDLEGFQTVFGGHGLYFALDAQDQRDFGGDGDRETHGGRHFVCHFVEHGHFVEVQVESLAQFAGDFAHVEVVFAQHGSDQFAFDRQESVVLIFEFHVQQSFGLVFFDVFFEGRENVVQFVFVVFHVEHVFDVAVGEDVGFAVEASDHGFQTFSDQTEADQIFVPESQEVRVQSGGQVVGHHVLVGEGRSQFQVQTDLLFDAVDGETVDFAVAEQRSVYSARVAESHAHVGNQFLFAGVGGVGQSFHVGLNERGDLDLSFGLNHLDDLVNDWAFGQSLEDHVRAGDSDGRGFQFVHQDWHQDFLDFFGHDVFQLTHGQNGFGSDQGRILALAIEDDFLQFEDAQVQTSVAQSFQDGQFFFPFVGFVQFAR